MPKDCPACGVTNTDTAILCDCGWSFAGGNVIQTGEPTPSAAEISSALWYEAKYYGKRIAKWSAIVAGGIIAGGGGGVVGLLLYVIMLAILRRRPTELPPV